MRSSRLWGLEVKTDWPCEDCHGTGEIEESDINAQGHYRGQVKVPCYSCGGDGLADMTPEEYEKASDKFLTECLELRAAILRDMGILPN